MAQAARSLFEQPDPGASGASHGLKLHRLVLRNFKGIRELEFDPAGANADIHGDNATGKTTIFDAFTWLLFDKDSANRKDFEIKTLTPDGQPLHGLEHEVQGTFAIAGRQLTLRKMYAEKWVKTRGSAERTFSGHETTYFIDGVPTKKSDYESRIASILDEKVFRLLSDPTHFNEQLHWQERRKLLLEVCGDISDAEVIASDPALEPLSEILGSRSLEDHRKVLIARRSKINKELEQIPVRISEVQRGLPDVADLDVVAAEQLLGGARAQRKEKVEQLARIEQGGAAAEKHRQLTETDAGLLEIETAHRRRNEQAYSAKLRAVQDARAKVADVERELQTYRNNLLDAEDRAGELEGSLHKLRKEFRTVSDEELTYSADTVCPICGQALPEEQVEEARAKALEQFNVSKASRTERINADGKALKAKQAQANGAAAEARKRISQLEESLPALRKATLDAQAEANRVVTALDNSAVAKDPEYAKLVGERDKLAAEVERLKAGGEAETAGLRDEIAGLEQSVATAERTLSLFDQFRRGTERLAELSDEEKALAAEFEQLESELYLTEEFVRVKVRLLEDRINSRFDHARFKLFDVQVNGALAERCDTLFDGVPYGSGLNRGARLNVGLDIINTLSEHIGFAVPVWVDNAEAVTQLIPVKAQLFRLVVSESDKSLRVEVQ